MRILWISQTTIKEGLAAIGVKREYLGATWMTSQMNMLANNEEIELSIAFMDKSVKKVTKVISENITYYILPKQKKEYIYSEKFEKIYNNIIKQISPDVIHIFGTESVIALEVLNSTNIKTIIQITGIISICAEQYYAGLSEKIIKKKSIGDFLRRRGIKKQKQLFERRGKYEKEAIKKVKYIIGKTNWDKNCVEILNKNCKYYRVNEILREEFYYDKWELKKCEKNSIFMTQGSYPLKGLHFVIKAIGLLNKNGIDVKLYISGNNIIKNDTVKDKLRMTSYGKYIRKLIKENEVDKNVIFLGGLGEKELKERMLKSNIFICASSIENESNSLSEAKKLGVPCIVSFVGGVSERINHEESGYLYQYESYRMLAGYIKIILDKDEIAKKISGNAKKEAEICNDTKKNITKLIEVYKEVFNE